MPQSRTSTPTPVDSHETPVIRLPTILSAGGGEQRSATPPHDHPGDELVFIEHGSALVTCADHDFAGARGSLFLFPQGCVHDQRNLPGAHSWFVVFHCRGRRFPRSPRLLQLAPDDPLQRWFPELCRQHLASDGVPNAVAALLLAVLERLAALDGRSLADQALPAPVSAAMRRCERHLTEDLSSTTIARAAGVSPSHLRALFRTHLGVSPQEHHQYLRLDLAAKLLRTSYLSVGEVAAACGWSDANYFGRIFTRRFAASPRTWRTRHRI